MAYRWGTARLARLGIVSDAHGHGHSFPTHATHGPLSDKAVAEEDGSLKEEGRETTYPNASPDLEARKDGYPGAVGDSAAAQILGIAILEFGVLLHSILIGLTLAVDDEFKILFVVIIFHRTHIIPT